MWGVTNPENHTDFGIFVNQVGGNRDGRVLILCLTLVVESIPEHKFKTGIMSMSAVEGLLFI